MTDWLTLRASALEITARYARARVDAVELEDGVLSIGLRGQFPASGLALDLRPKMPPVHVTGPVAQSRGGAPRLQVLRRSLLGAHLEGAYVPFGERVLMICFLGRDRFGDPLPLHIAAEYYGTRPDILGAESGLIVFALHGRRLTPGDRLRLPPLSPSPHRSLRSAPSLAPGEAAARAARGDFAPCLIPGKAPQLDLFGGTADARVLDVLTEIARVTGHELRRDQVARSLSERLERRFSARERTLFEKERELAETEGADLLRRQGEALKLALGRVPPGSSEVRLQDPYAPGSDIVVPLDPELSPEDNMEALFRRYRKLRARHSRFGGEIENLREEVQALSRVRATLRAAQTIEDLQRVAADAPEIFSPGTSSRGQAGDRAQGPLRFQTQGGHELLVGRSAQENERLTRGARPSDLWFHAKDRQGAHCILRPLPGRAVGAPDRLDAALIAAFYSKGRQGSHVPVDYTHVRHLRKARGAGPGHFLYDHHETLFVTPDPESVDQIRSRRGSPRS